MVNLTSEEYNRLLEAINHSASQTRTEIKNHIQNENDRIFASLNEQQEQVQQLTKQCSTLDNKVIELERKLRKNNIIIHGLENPVEGEHLVTKVINFFNSYLGVDVLESELNNLYILKKKQQNGKPDPIKVEFLTYFKKSIIFANTRKLKNTNIFISHDLCFQDRQDHRILHQNLKLAKSKNQNAKIVSGNRLLINGDIYSVKDLQEIDSDTNIVEVEEVEESIIQKGNSLPNTPSIENIEEIFEQNYQEIAKKPEETETPLKQQITKDSDTGKKGGPKNKEKQKKRERESFGKVPSSAELKKPKVTTPASNKFSAKEK